ncbi:hypothetical protein S40288_11174 [Stachybotrys chartarum IBT 40288]|nr:hypothetical protein S40288_11174 [Stachybotrys chartarum IBT 40288]
MSAQEQRLYMEGMSVLLRGGADINRQGMMETLLSNAESYYALDIMRFLLDYGAQVDPMEPPDQYRDKHVHNCVDLLLREGAKVDALTFAHFLNKEHFDLCRKFISVGRAAHDATSVWTHYFLQVSDHAPLSSKEVCFGFLWDHFRPPIVDGSFTCNEREYKNWMNLLGKLVCSEVLALQAVTHLLHDVYSKPQTYMGGSDLIIRLLGNFRYIHSQHFKLLENFVNRGLSVTDRCKDVFKRWSVQDFDHLIRYLCENGLTLTEKCHNLRGLLDTASQDNMHYLFSRPEIMACYRQRLQAVDADRVLKHEQFQILDNLERNALLYEQEVGDL